MDIFKGKGGHTQRGTEHINRKGERKTNNIKQQSNENSKQQHQTGRALY